MDLADFLKARLDEDKAVADGLFFACLIPERVPDFTAAGGPAAEQFWGHFTAHRMADEVEAKRAIIKRYEDQAARQNKEVTGKTFSSLPPGAALDALIAQERTYALWSLLPALAAVYSDHPDYDEAWAIPQQPSPGGGTEPSPSSPLL